MSQKIENNNQNQKQIHQKDSDDDYQSCNSDDSVDIALLIQEKIKQLPCLSDKIQAIAINSYVQQRRKLDDELDEEKVKLQYKMRNLLNPSIQQINNIIDSGSALNKDDFQFIMANKQLLNPQQIIFMEKLIKGQVKDQDNSAIKNVMQDYWLKCMLNSDIIGQQIHQKDMDVLKNLYKINAQRNQDSTKLTVTFYFRPNKYIANQSLKKIFKIKKDKEQAQKSQGDEIQWKNGMNYTVEVVNKGKKKGKKQKKQQIIKHPSFFHYFTPISSIGSQNPDITDDDDWDDLMQDLQVQYQLSVHILQDLIPKSLQFYLNCKAKDDIQQQEQLQQIQQQHQQNQQQHQEEKQEKNKQNVEEH